MFDTGLVQNVLQGIFSAAFLASILRVTTPILLPSLGALVSDRAGVINIGLEGTMLVSAFSGVVFNAYSREWFGESAAQSVGPWLGMIMGVVIGVLLALLLAVFHLRFKANIILSGIALNILGSAGTVAIMYELAGDRGSTQGRLRSMRMPFIQLPEFLNDIPIASFFFRILDNQSVMTWIAFLAVGAVWYFLYRMPAGIHLRAVGENPDAAASVGIRVTRVRYLALALSGALAGLGGVHMSMGYLSFFQRDMTAGRGFIALATPSLGGGHPVGTGLASLVFGFFDAISSRVGTLEIPSHLPQMLPYIATIIALVIYALQSSLAARVRALRAAQGAAFDAAFWRAIRRLSVLHMFMAIVAVFGLIISLSMFAAPDGFQGRATAYPLAAILGGASLLLILLNLPPMLKVERIGVQVFPMAAGAIVSLWIYLGILLTLMLYATSLQNSALVLGFGAGLVAAIVIWLALGGYYLLTGRRQRRFAGEEA